MTQLEQQWEMVLRKEASFLKRSKEKTPTKLEELLEEKVPDKLYDTLNTAFTKAFGLVFEKGTKIIEKSYNKEELKHEYKVKEFSLDLKQDKKRFQSFQNAADLATGKNVVASAVKGVGLGLFGIGLPDIPVFITVILKGIYEIALRYGYEYESEEERYFILKIISTSLSYGDEMMLGNSQLNRFISRKKLPSNYRQSEEISMVSEVLASELLCMKFLQGVPLVGTIGGVADAVFVNKILGYAKLKYQRRFLRDKLELGLPDKSKN